MNGATGSQQRPTRIWRDDAERIATRALPREAAVAIVVNGSTHAVMLATPGDLLDFGRGFALTERLVETPAEIESIEIAEQASGTEVRLWLSPARAAAAESARRRLVGPTGCGLCGVESLDAALPPVRAVAATGPRPTPEEIIAAVATLGDAQPLGAETRAVHAAALWRRGAALIVREDVGRHNALDKLVGAVAGADCSDALLLLTSRVSVEMVAKAAILGTPIIVAVSAPTTLAVDTAVAAGLTLVAVARADGFEIFCGEERIAMRTDKGERSSG